MRDNKNKESLQALSRSYRYMTKLKEVNEKLVSERKTEARHLRFKECRKAIGRERRPEFYLPLHAYESAEKELFSVIANQLNFTKG